MNSPCRAGEAVYFYDYVQKSLHYPYQLAKNMNFNQFQLSSWREQVRYLLVFLRRSMFFVRSSLIRQIKNTCGHKRPLVQLFRWLMHFLNTRKSGYSLMTGAAKYWWLVFPRFDYLNTAVCGILPAEQTCLAESVCWLNPHHQLSFPAIKILNLGFYYFDFCWLLRGLKFQNIVGTLFDLSTGRKKHYWRVIIVNIYCHSFSLIWNSRCCFRFVLMSTVLVQFHEFRLYYLE